MDRLVSHLILVSGWRRRLIALMAGAASVGALPPFDVFPVLFLTIPVLVYLLDGAAAESEGGFRFRPGTRFSVGWWFGFGWFGLGLSWIAEAFLVEPERHALLLPFALVGLGGGLAIFTGLATSLAARIWPDGWTRILSLASALAAADWLRGHVFSGFPWNLFGMTLSGSDATMQIASLTGAYGMSFIALALAGAPAVLFPRRLRSRGGFVYLASVFAAILVLAGWGAMRLSGAEDRVVAGVNLRIVQPAIDQRDKWDPEKRQEIFARYVELSAARLGPDRVGLLTTTHLIWPESAFPFVLTEEPAALAAIAELLPLGTTLITGAVRVERGAGRPRVFNSIHVIAESGEITGSYDKVQLVPFGEAIPFADRLEPLGILPLVNAPRSFTPGTRRESLSLSPAPAALPLICYEIIFPGTVATAGEPRPGWLLNLTNDAWFGTSFGPWQHFRQARMRAVEEGLPLVRAANTGVSAVTDAYGRVEEILPLGQSGVIDAALPQAIDPPFYARHGDLTLLGFLLCGFGICLYGRFTSLSS
ncbi:MAG: apolipoprotein N-acyltransferase [Hyphomicrobiaceae bacterium]|nr:apolipoprotein N-acyltransferase [Hyphomicrobiaceae bacterium]